MANVHFGSHQERSATEQSGLSDVGKSTGFMRFIRPDLVTIKTKVVRAPGLQPFLKQYQWALV